MRALTMAASLLAELAVAARHQMVQMVDGPVCGQCGRSWLWRSEAAG